MLSMSGSKGNNNKGPYNVYNCVEHLENAMYLGTDKMDGIVWHAFGNIVWIKISHKQLSNDNF